MMMSTNMLANQYLLDAPKCAPHIYGEIVLLWLFIRGLILKRLNRIWEAIYMFKLIESCKEIAPRNKFVVFASYVELAELLLDYDLFPNTSDDSTSSSGGNNHHGPYILCAEYLKRACVALRRIYETGYVHYVHLYRRKMHTLVERLENLR